MSEKISLDSSVLDYIFNCGFDFEYVVDKVDAINGNR